MLCAIEFKAKNARLDRFRKTSSALSEQEAGYLIKRIHLAFRNS